MPVKVKICGICRVEDARAAVDAGADFLGLNFHPASPRCVTVEDAVAIADAVAGTALVGVFVDASRARVEDIAARVGTVHERLADEDRPCAGSRHPADVVG